MRGLRQGEPLSPALFILGAEVLSRSLNNLHLDPSYARFKVSSGCQSVSHLAYADDVLIFTSAASQSLKRVMTVLRGYEAVSGQLINLQKSGFLVHHRLSGNRLQVIRRHTGFSHRTFPIKYLGCPLFYGRSKHTYFEAIL